MITVIAIAYGITWIATFSKEVPQSVKADPIDVNSVVSNQTDPPEIVT